MGLALYAATCQANNDDGWMQCLASLLNHATEVLDDHYTYRAVAGAIITVKGE